ncbi:MULTISPECIES: phosphonate metabolism protein/1,5-bisphosphokinase (PRPP-forming) PhnN [unclassified Methylobacterium]|uniref:phosphonate metabolism protein/1,5-bisphosphokinase (PRPP-forming) PhnN n=1 Tax=unclassified Methylobacterium TaxID=2615210 RepID=UPI0011C7F43D|nr:MULTISPECIES: phosphonate metabolism protein/1,5-bisphosphokinase (PRPP-forming) PhnN [unclassified Methylobacterium]TXM71545.1 phosphonate metabolism protein/1,5-bisphosphokinase (PRPP-forming) PhnN [Methylobacterium sp. WL12]TXN80614.1 phosphonate metabolism protein/1,5-bisphosphokinase (PRPP-forming) PhnN [Methylobacterium sp. WL8]
MAERPIGGFVLVVGPSGAGKDTVIAAARARLAGDPPFVFPRRLVTRPPSAHEDNAEIAEADFSRAAAAGAFPLHWRVHGLGYAIPPDALEEAARGRIVVCNISRRVIEAARRMLPGVHVVAITAAPETLAARLAARDRPEDGDLGARLARAVPAEADATVVNDSERSIATANFVAILLDRAGRR